MFDTIFAILGTALRIALWVIETILLGSLLLTRLPSIWERASLALAKEVECNEGHRVSTYGRTQCRRCGGIRVAWLFGPCPGCHARPAYITCPRCQSSIWSPVA